MPSTLPHKYHDEIVANGFTVIRKLLSPEEIDHYLKLSQKEIDTARDGKWPYVRLNGKQFPPWDKPEDQPDIWGVTHLMHPKWGQVGKDFQKLYTDEKILNIVKDILQTDILNMELLNMLINPSKKDFDLCWHRDDVKNTATDEEEMELLERCAFAGAQFNLALKEDVNLIVIPDSHVRPRTSEEREKLKFEPITNQLVVHLEPGDCAFYNPNILHRATYSTKRERVTIHGSYGNFSIGKNRARLVLQHGVADWLDQLEPINEEMRVLSDRLKEIAKEMKGKDLGYSLDG
ncbi:DEKNAAC102853 [Brettanomyces naardenensis]|uniref:DEKNAAC102853 n=1 Tax=Brettanomyces naardenensis TaxID=13370 RepID=A0A448YLN1_BRENA|nr:DEKNAAC102853 [Brettanomyces naardenensis]